jgi:hypothetical protein
LSGQLSSNTREVGWREIWRRIKKPLSQGNFRIALFAGVLFCGGWGFWKSLAIWYFFPSAGIDIWTDSITALATFYPALIGGACVQLLIAPHENYIRGNVLSVATVVGILTALLFLGEATTGKISTISAITIFLCTITGVLAWCVANSENRDFRDYDPGGALGKDPNKIPKGKAKGWNR